MSLNKKSVLSAPLFMMIIISFGQSMGSTMLQFMITTYALDIGIKAELAATLVSAISVTSLIMRPVAGRLSDAMNKKLLMIISLAGACFAMVLYMLADGFALLLVARLVHGVSSGLSMVVCLTVAASFVPKERVGTGIAVYGIGQSLSVLGATKVAQIIYGAGGGRMLFLAGMGFAGAALLLACFVPVPKQEKTTRASFAPKEILRGLFCREAIPFALLNIVFNGCQTMVSFLVVYCQVSAANGKMIGDAGIIMMLWGAGIMLLKPYVGKLVDKFGVAKMEAVCLASTAIFVIIMGITPSAWITYPATLILGGLGGCGAAVQQAGAYAAAGQKSKGSASSTNLIGGDIGNAVGAMVTGKMISMFTMESNPTFGYQISFVLGAIPLILAALFCIVFRKSKMFRPARQTDTV